MIAARSVLVVAFLFCLGVRFQLTLMNKKCVALVVFRAGWEWSLFSSQLVASFIDELRAGLTGLGVASQLAAKGALLVYTHSANGVCNLWTGESFSEGPFFQPEGLSH